MSFKRLFSRSFAAAPGRLHMAAHSHHLWPDASFDGQVECWNDAAALADGKWDKVMGEVWPEAQAHVARELGSETPEAVVFAPNTHELLVRLVAAAPRTRSAIRILTSDGEFHSARRQLARWVESGEAIVDQVDVEPFDTFGERFRNAARRGTHDLVFVSHVFFGTGRVLDGLDALSALARPQGPWVAIDGYHAFMALPQPVSQADPAAVFYLGGGYKYAMAGEGAAFLHAPQGYGQRPPVTGWFAEFEDLSLPAGMVGYRQDAMRFMGATFDPSALYRFNAVQRMLLAECLTTERISEHVAGLQRRLAEAIRKTPLGRAEPLNPLDGGHRARFLAFRSPDAQRWCAELKARDCITDVRGDVIRIGLGVYHDAEDIDAFAALAAELD